MKRYKNFSVQEYCEALAARAPVPGGGSAAALVAVLAVALLEMVTRYSLGKRQPQAVERRLKDTLRESKVIHRKLLDLVDLDAQAYLKVCEAREKNDPALMKRALVKAGQVPLNVCRLCYAALQLTPLLAEKGNKFLLSDVEVAIEFLLAAFNAAKVNIKVNWGS